MRLKSSRGFSLIEIAISMVILTVVLGLLTKMGTVSRARVLEVSRLECENVVNSTMNNIKNFGYEAKRAPINPDTEEINTAGITLDGVPSWFTWPNGNEPSKEKLPDGRTMLHTYRTIVGSMRLLNDLYNSNIGYCQTPQGLPFPPGFTGFVPEYDNDESAAGTRLKNLQTTIRITHYHIITGQLGCTEPPIYVRPMSAGNIINNELFHPSMEESGLMERPPGTMQHIGFEVTINATYEDENLGKKGCGVKSRFTYPRLPELDNLSVVAPIISQGSLNTCQKDRTTATMNIIIPPLVRDENITYMCSDQSVAFPLAFNCLGGVTGDRFTADSTWKPCNQVTLCARPPVSSGITNGEIVNEYDEMPWGCIGKVLIRAINPSGDTSDPKTGWMLSLLPECEFCQRTACEISYRYCAPTRCLWCPGPPTDPDPGGSGSWDSTDGKQDGSDGGDSGGGGIGDGNDQD